MSQTVTFTRRSDAAADASAPATFTVEISDDTNQATAGTIEDAEIQAGQSAGSTYAAEKKIDLSQYQISSIRSGATNMALDSARYLTVVGGGNSSAGNTNPDTGNTGSNGDLVSAPNEGGLLSFGAAFRYQIGLGDKTHDGPGGEITATKQWNSYEHFRPRVTAGVTAQTVGMQYALPGSSKEDADSRFRLFGGVIGGGFRTPFAASNRLAFDFETFLRLGYVWTPDSKMGTLKTGGKQVCIDAGAGRQQCFNEQIGSAETNLGRAGGYVPSVGNSIGQSGLGVDGSLRLLLNYSIPVNNSAINIAAGAEFGNFSTHTDAASRGEFHFGPAFKVSADF